MTIVLWVIGIALVIIGLVGTVLPALPGAMLIVAGLVVAAWADGFTKVGIVTLVIIGVIGAASYLVDFAAAAISSILRRQRSARRGLAPVRERWSAPGSARYSGYSSACRASSSARSLAR
jgi:uncharacterized protein YqgC (DUF456 family)